MKALIVKTSSLGDILHAFPVLSYLRSRGCSVDWVVEQRFCELVRAHPEVGEVQEVEPKAWRKSLFGAFRCRLRERRYDVLFDLQGNIKSGLVTAQARAKFKVGFGWKTVTEWPNLLVTRRRFNPPLGRNIREDYLYLAQRFFNDDELFPIPGVVLSGKDELRLEPSGFHLVVCPGSAWPNKQLSEETLMALIRHRWPDASLIWVWGTDEERARVEHCRAQLGGLVAPRLSLPGLQRLMAQADAVLAMDSLPLHLCGTTKTPSFSFFGPSSAAKYRPLGPQHRSLQGSCPYGQTFAKRCRRLRSCPTGACLKQIRVEEVFLEFSQTGWYNGCETP